MRVQFHTLSAGPGGVREPGSIHELPAAEAQALIAGRYASAMSPTTDPSPSPAPCVCGRCRECLDRQQSQMAQTPEDAAPPSATAALDARGRRKKK